MAEKVKASKLTDDKVAARLARLAEEKASKALHITRQLDLEKIEVLSERIEKLLKSNNTLRNGTSKNEKDSHEIALYFKREMEIKDETIAKLNEEIIKRDTQVKFEAEKIKRRHDEDLNELRFGTEHTTSELRMKLLATENDLSTLEAYRKGKDTYDETLVALEKLLKEESESKIIALEVQERTFFEEKAHIFKDLDRRKESLREIALKEARDAMGAEAMKISADNFRMYDELKFLHTMTAQIETEKVTSAVPTEEHALYHFTDLTLTHHKEDYRKS